MELKFYYSNKQPIPVKFAFTFRIINIDKEYVFYGLGEEQADKEAVYFGELIGNAMSPVNQYDLEVFKKFIAALASNQITKDSLEYLQTIHNVLEVEVKGGQKTQIAMSVLDPYKKEPNVAELYGKKETSVIDEQPGVVEVLEPTTTNTETPVQEVTSEPVSEATPVAEGPVLPAVEQTPVVEEPTAATEPKKEKKPKNKKKGLMILITVLVLILLGVGIYFGYLWIKDNNKKPNEKPNVPETPVVETKSLACTKDSTLEDSDIKQTQLVKLHFKDGKLTLMENSTNSTFIDEIEYTLTKEASADVLPLGVTQTKNCNDASLTCSVTKNLDIINMDAAGKTEYSITDGLTLEQYQEQYKNNGFECK